MGIEHAERDPHWNYFLALEDDVVRMSRWIEFSEANSETYSIELARLLMTAAAEVDVVAKRACAKLSSTAKADSIEKYRRILLGKYPDLTKAQVNVDRFGLKLKPWSSWADGKPPHWWTANNKVKHHRESRFADANLKNVLNATAGLLILLVIHFDGVRRAIAPPPMHFRPVGLAHVGKTEMTIHWSDGSRP